MPRSPFRDESAAALEKVAQLEEENRRLAAENRRLELEGGRLRGELHRANMPAYFAIAIFVFGGGACALGLWIARTVSREPLAVLRKPDLTVASYETAVATSDVPLSGPIAPLEDLPFRSRCAFEAKIATLKVAVRDGRPVGLSVYTNPRDPMLAFCIESHATELRFPQDPGLRSYRRELP